MAIFHQGPRGALRITGLDAQQGSIAEVLDVLGKRVHPPISPSAANNELELTGLNAGSYLLRTTSANGTSLKRKHSDERTRSVC